jgi:mannose PTS system EIID component
MAGPPLSSERAGGGFALPLRVRLATVLRSCLVQASWNYQTLLGTGFAFVMLPAIRYLHRDDPATVRALTGRHADLFNSHPFLATLAAGALIRIEAEGRGPDIARRFKNALRGSLGSIGDQLVWRTWRPACALVGIGLLLVGAPWWLAIAAYLLLFNALNVALRWWGLEVGLSAGFEVGSRLRSPWLANLRERGADAGAVLAGLVLVLAIGTFSAGVGGMLAKLVAAAAGVALAVWVRPVVWLGLVLFWLIGIALGMML